MMRRVALLALLLPPVHAPAVSPGGDLEALLGSPLDASLRAGLNGTPPSARGWLPRAPEAPGSHWLVLYDAQGHITRWIRFEVEGSIEPAASRTLALRVDREAPIAELVVTGPHLRRADGLVLGPGGSLRVDAEDAGGVARATLLAADQVLGTDASWTPGASSAPLQLRAEVEDRLGNRTVHGPWPARADFDPPWLEWRRLDPQPDVPDDVVGRDGARVAVTLRDADAGPSSLRLAERHWDLVQGGASARELELTLPPDPAALSWQAEDRVGNRTRGVLPLRIDTEAPRLRLRGAEGRDIEAHGARVRRDEVLELVVEDALAGVERACVEASIWYGECRALPTTLRGLSPGRYALRLRAVDRLGNRRSERVHIEVQR